MKKDAVVKNYYILPCCLLLLNLVNSVVSYKAGVIHDPFLRTGVTMGLVLIGGSIVAFVAWPAIEALIRWMHSTSRQKGGGLGEIIFLVALGLVIYVLYYRAYIYGPQAILPPEWRNPTGHIIKR